MPYRVVMKRVGDLLEFKTNDALLASIRKTANGLYSLTVGEGKHKYPEYATETQAIEVAKDRITNFLQGYGVNCYFVEENPEKTDNVPAPMNVAQTQSPASKVENRGAETIKISVLPLQDIRFVKTISFSLKRFGVPHLAKVVYSRGLSADYKMRRNADANPLYFGYTEDSYPVDDIDDLIFYAIKNVADDAAVKTSLMLFDTEQLTFQRQLAGMTHGKLTIQANPQFDDIEKVIRSGKTQWPVKLATLDLYCHAGDKELLGDICSIINYDINRETEFIALWQRMLDSVGSI